MDWTPEAQAALWGAGATLVTGLSAVGGAVFVGLRQADIQSKQTRITERQTKILDRQIALSELTLRNELFDKRYAIYAATNDFLVTAIQNGGWVGPSDPAIRPYLLARDRAKFLFRPSVHADLQEIWDKVSEGLEVNDAMTRLYAAEGHYGPEYPQRRFDISVWLDARRSSLSEVFGHELKLSDHDMQMG